MKDAKQLINKWIAVREAFSNLGRWTDFPNGYSLRHRGTQLFKVAYVLHAAPEEAGENLDAFCQRTLNKSFNDTKQTKVDQIPGMKNTNDICDPFPS